MIIGGNITLSITYISAGAASPQNQTPKHAPKAQAVSPSEFFPSHTHTHTQKNKNLKIISSHRRPFFFNEGADLSFPLITKFTLSHQKPKKKGSQTHTHTHTRWHLQLYVFIIIITPLCCFFFLLLRHQALPQP